MVFYKWLDVIKCPRRDSNPHHQNRNLTFYPLNYEDILMGQIYKID
jgi:hypothetical protein